MKPNYMRTTVTALWVLSMCAVGVVANSNSFSTWAVLAGLAALGPIVMFWLWIDPASTLSESIQEARR